jgi:hypothetical protein
MPRCRRLLALVPSIAIVAAGCGRGPAYGSDNAIIAVVDPELREELEPVIRRTFEREAFTTRPEPIFEVTFASSDDIGEFRRWKRILVVEPADEDATLVPELLGGDRLAAARSGGVVAEIEDEWARDQTIWVVSAPTPAATARLLRAKADSLYEVAHTRYVAGEVDRMWASEPDSALAEQLLEEHGFALVLPQVYTSAPGSAPPNTLTFYNDNPRRVISIHWTPRPVEITADTVLGIRRALGEALFPGDTIPARVAPFEGTMPAPDTTGADTTFAPPTPLLVSETTIAGRPAIRLQGVWQNPNDRTAGIFLTYGVGCGDRLVILDGNVFAPDRPKYPYLVQLERIFATFRCAAEG